jgi:hypothetical protein
MNSFLRFSSLLFVWSCIPESSREEVWELSIAENTISAQNTLNTQENWSVHFSKTSIEISILDSTLPKDDWKKNQAFALGENSLLFVWDNPQQEHPLLVWKNDFWSIMITSYDSMALYYPLDAPPDIWISPLPEPSPSIWGDLNFPIYWNTANTVQHQNQASETTLGLNWSASKIQWRMKTQP